MKTDLKTYQLADPGFMSEYRAQVRRDQIKSVCIIIALFVVGLVLFESCAAWDADEYPVHQSTK